MDSEVQQRLLALNKEFYATVAEPFDLTRLAPSAGKSELVRRLPLDKMRPSVADIGCGNGRLAWLLEERGVPLDYVGVDANAQLLALAQVHTAELRYVRASFVQADLAQPDWREELTEAAAGGDGRFDIVTCLATLHHLPGYDLRCATMQRLATLVESGGIVAISTWQFLTSPRFTAKVVDWGEVGVDPAQVEPGDALLPWKQGGYAVRYLHQIDMDEVRELAATAGLEVEATYFADGKEGNLNLYALLRRP
jgi:2-polyprenyl-3-methyl-5-hydroxy-6-metoxy-1,4-benzoquinol methylase